MSLLLITGAGASRDLGAEEEPMPLMADWSDALCDALDQRESNLAAACGLVRGSSGPEFEENLGLLLRWQSVRHLEERFQRLGGPSAGDVFPQVGSARQETSKRMQVVMETINMTLFQRFGQARVDDDRARSAYGALLKFFDYPELVVATTNYDRSVEAALEELGHDVDAGFRGAPARIRRLEPVGLVTESEKSTPVIHLHGAVGWYEQGGHVVEHPADLGFNDSLGTPVVLYPDPDKDPTNDALVDELWLEFEAALEAATGVLVIGHSLHDPALVRALVKVAKQKPTVIGYVKAEDQGRIEKAVPGAQPLELTFGPEIETAGGQVLSDLKKALARA